MPMPPKKRPIALVAILVATAASPAPLTPAGRNLARLIDGMDVEHNWKAGESVHWLTGRTDRLGHQQATHCSAFAAAVCAKSDIYLLRPPRHSQELLASAQNHWLKTEGAQSGWRRVSTQVEAQRLANLGEIVLASYPNPDRKKPGHIAVVRPCEKSEGQIALEGPQLAQAGRLNSANTSLRQGLAHHPGAWEEHRVEFFAHVPAKKVDFIRRSDAASPSTMACANASRGRRSN
jgi:hypothetical protein